MLYGILFGIVMFVVGIVLGWKANNILRAVAKRYARIKKLEHLYAKSKKAKRFQKNYNHEII